MDNFLIAVEFDDSTGTYMARFADGQDIALCATDFYDAVLEADQLASCNYELGYN